MSDFLLNSLPSDTVDLWIFSLELRAEEAAFLEGTLSQLERDRAARFRFPRDQTRFIAGRSTMRRILSRYLEIPPESLPIVNARDGKPYLSGVVRDLRFNLSHSNNMAALAVTEIREVGVDIEQVRPVPELMDIASGLFARDEVGVLRETSPENRLDTFFRIWTRKEACLKALGSGLLAPLDQFNVVSNGDQAVWIDRLERNWNEATEVISLAETEVNVPADAGAVEHYKIALAICGPPARVRTHHNSPPS